MSDTNVGSSKYFSAAEVEAFYQKELAFGRSIDLEEEVASTIARIFADGLPQTPAA